jgi:hypothetical protein
VKWLFLGVLVSTTTFAGRPLTVDDAGTVEPRQFQLEAGCGYVHDDSTQHYDFPLGLSYGVLPTLQAGIGFGGQLEERLEDTGDHCTESGIGDLTVGAKWHPLSAERFWADHALALTVKVPTADCDRGLGSGLLDYDLTYIATKSLGEKFNVDFNLGYTWVGGDDDVLHYGLALRWQALEKVELVGEVFADTPLTRESDTSVAMSAGLRWTVVDDFVLDAAAGAGLHGDAPDWTATIGLTWTVGFGNPK